MATKSTPHISEESPREASRQKPKDSTKNWSIFVCSKEKNPIAISVPHPREWTVTDVKQEIEKRLAIPLDDQVIYWKEKVLHSLPLADCEGMRNGATLFVGTKPPKPFVINLYRNDADVTLPLEITITDSLTMAQLHSIVLAKVGIPSYCRVLLAIGDYIINNRDLVSRYRPICSGCLIVLTFLSPMLLNLTGLGEQQVCIPSWFTSKTGFQFLSRHVFTDGNLSPVWCFHDDRDQSNHWTLHVRQHKGRKGAVELPHGPLTPVADLKHQVQKKLSVKTYQQRLAVGDEILEDYDHKGQWMLLCNYPAIYDGATLYLDCTEGGMQVMTSSPIAIKYTDISQRNFHYRSRSNGPTHTFLYSYAPINIPDARTFSVQKLKHRLKGQYICEATNCNLSHVPCRPSDPIALIHWLKNEMTFRSAQENQNSH